MTVKPQGLPAGLICPGLNLFSTDILQKPEDPHSNYLCDIVDIDIHPFLQDPEDPEHENSSAWPETTVQKDKRKKEKKKKTLIP